MFVGIILQYLVKIVLAEAKEFVVSVFKHNIIPTFGSQLAEAAQAHCAAAVFGRGDVFKIVNVVIERIAVFMINLTAGRHCSFPCPIHGFVATDGVEMPHE